jgi:hypothetical protein
MATAEKTPKSDRVPAMERQVAEGNLVKIRVNNMPLLKNFGMSKLADYQEEFRDDVKHVECVDKETGRFDVYIDRRAKEQKEIADYTEARGYAPGQHKSVVESSLPNVGGRTEEIREVDTVTSGTLHDELPSASASAAPNFDE